MFLSAQENEAGETLYQITPPCVPFIANVSRNLTYFGALERKVEHFKTEGAKVTPREAALIVTMQQHIRRREVASIVALADKMPSNDLALENPKIKSLLGQAYSELGPRTREKARECFKHAEGLGYRDIFMMRRWFHLEFTSGYGLSEAERLCRVVIESAKFGPRYKCEFWSKLGSCLLIRANSVIGASREKGLGYLRESILAYLEAIWIGRSLRDIDISDTFVWVERPLQRFVLAVRGDIEQFFELLENLIERKHDVDDEAVGLVLQYLSKSNVPADRAIRDRVKGLCSRSIGKINRSMRPLHAHPGFERIVETLEAVVEQLDHAPSTKV